jgi:hypothetical protein
MRTAFESEGDVRSVDLLAAFATLWRQRATGVLTFSQPGPHVRFEIIEGDVVGVFSSDPIFDTAEVLIRAGKLDPAALEGRRLPAERDRARAARELGLVTERDWRWAEKIRAVEILSDVVDWLEGSYAWDVFQRPESGELRIGIERLLLELFLRSPDRELIHRSLGAVDAPLQRAADFDEKFLALGLTAEALAVAEAIDGRATAAEISRRAPPDPFSVEKLLAALATLGLVHPEYAAEPPPAPAATRRTASPPPAAEPAPEVEPAESELVASELPGPAAGVPMEEAPPTEAPIELPLAPDPEPAEPEPVLTSWEPAPAEPMDQSLDLPEPPVVLRSHRPSLTGVWLLVVLAGAVGALLLFRARQPGKPPTTSTLPAATTPTASAALAATAPPTALPPTAAPPTEISATRTPISRPTPTAHPRPTATAAAIGAAPRAPAAGRRQWLARAERDRTLLQRDPHAPYTIQLELVCELSSLEEAWKFDRRGAMWLLTTSHRGRECFRVFWGHYATLDEAHAAKASVPRFFFTATNQPAVVSTRSALLR